MALSCFISHFSLHWCLKCEFVDRLISPCKPHSYVCICEVYGYRAIDMWKYLKWAIEKKNSKWHIGETAKQKSVLLPCSLSSYSSKTAMRQVPGLLGLKCELQNLVQRFLAFKDLLNEDHRWEALWLLQTGHSFPFCSSSFSKNDCEEPCMTKPDSACQIHCPGLFAFNLGSFIQF